jgi:hypothetical protein
MFKLEEICEELSQIQIPMRAEELESTGVHVEEEASADEAERYQDGYLRDVHNCLAERRKTSCRAALVRPAATAAILEVDPVEAYLIWQFTDSWLPYVVRCAFCNGLLRLTIPSFNKLWRRCTGSKFRSKWLNDV